jgi:general secretion pathway protein G
VRAKAQVASIRSGLSLLKSKQLLEGNTTALTSLDSNASSGSTGTSLFSDILEYPIVSQSGDGHWMKTSNTTYTIQIMGATNTFTFTPASWQFNCTSGTYCSTLTQ